MRHISSFKKQTDKTWVLTCLVLTCLKFHITYGIIKFQYIIGFNELISYIYIEYTKIVHC